MHNDTSNIVKDLTSVIIVNYNTGNYLKKCIESIYRYEIQDTFQIIIVDNGSKDNTEEIINPFLKKYNNIIFLKSGSNRGFASANNTGFKNSNGEYILILNPDIEFQSPLVNELKKHLNKDNCGAVSPLLLGANGNIQYDYYQKYPTIRQFLYFHSFASGIFKKNESLIKKYHYNKDLLRDVAELVNCSQLPCAFFLTKREIFIETGLMNGKYFLFFEDMDLSFRLKKKYELFTDTSKSVLHYGGSSFNIDKNPEIYGKYVLSMNIFFDLNYSALRALLLKIITLKNSFLILLAEYLKMIFRKNDNFRIKKHKYFLKLFKEHYF